MLFLHISTNSTSQPKLLFSDQNEVKEVQEQLVSLLLQYIHVYHGTTEMHDKILCCIKDLKELTWIRNQRILELQLVNSDPELHKLLEDVKILTHCMSCVYL